ncbi:MAG: hypothetical protein Q7S40_05380 [Opitutaceae bacterium]|nr:hypothetical protein [Opitutaceae bacterium]
MGELPRDARAHMSLWEYKVITSGKGGFATPALLEKFLNDLGRDEWEIVTFHSQPDNFLAFTGLARRQTQRDWTLEDAAAAAAKVEAEKLRAEFEAKFKAATAPAPAEERASDFLHEKVAPDDGFRKPVDTSHDAEPEVEEEEKDDWDKLTAREDEELPTFFEAIKPHMRRNQRGPGMSVGVDYLAKKWDQTEDDLKAALVECGFVVPEDEDAKTEYLEYDGDLFWLNVNRRGELWINTKEKPRAVFRPVKAQKTTVEEEPKPESKRNEAREQKAEERRQKAEEARERTETEGQPTEPGQPTEERPTEGEAAADGQAADQSAIRNPKPEIAPSELPTGASLLKKIRPHMRRNRRGPGGSGSTSFLSRALKVSEADLKAAFAGLGFTVPTSANDKPMYMEFGNEVWWLNADSRGGLWINGREKKPGEKLGAPGDEPTEAEKAETAATEPTPATAAESAAQAPAETAAATESRNEPAGEPVPPREPASGPTEQPGGFGATVSEIAAETNFPREVRSAAAGTAGPEQQPLFPMEQKPITESAAPVAPVPTDTATETISPAAAVNADILDAARQRLKEIKAGSVTGRIDQVAEELGRPPDALINELVGAGLKAPEKPREKPVYVERGGEILWLTRNAKGEIWLNARPAKSVE